MRTAEIKQNQVLEEAFMAFNQASEQLVSSYQVLEARVAQLTGELASARSERESQFREKERLADRLQTLLTALPAGVVVLDGNGTVQECNPAAIDLLGEPLIGEIWVEIISRSFAPRADDGHEVSLKDGRLVSISASSLGNEPGMILLLKDVTENRRMQERLDQNKRLSAMGEMAASLAHQIRTPLSSALLYSSHLSRSGLAYEDRLRFADKVRSPLRHLEKMINDMLLFVRGEQMVRENILMDDFIVEIEQLIESQLQATSSNLSIVNQLKGREFSGNRQALLGAVLNIASNAIEAGGSGTTLRLEVVMTVNEQIEFRLTDNGPGLSETDQARVFEPFFTRRVGGTGLGLAVVQAVAHAHGGEVWVKSQKGKGATFAIRFPMQYGQSSRENATSKMTLAGF